MESSNLKNMVVLKNVPSNMIEEAMIVLKKNIKIKETELQNCIENEVNKNTKKDISKEKSKDYIIKEAEMIIDHYMTNIENNEKISIYYINFMLYRNDIYIHKINHKNISSWIRLKKDMI